MHDRPPILVSYYSSHEGGTAIYFEIIDGESVGLDLGPALRVGKKQNRFPGALATNSFGRRPFFGSRGPWFGRTWRPFEYESIDECTISFATISP